ncbi:MAG: urea ABC transporter permease subunit UrtB, partial [Hyphomicrobiales bacterium]|nr:urea ABC transporter permease subunit UrtB [Hyphomicrobiales bacterium]
MRREPCILGFLLLLLALIPFGTRAAERSQLLASFASENFSEIDNAVVALAASGEELAPALLSALAERRLFYNAADKHVFWKGENGKNFDASTGAELPVLPAGLKPVRINNRVRATIEAALGSFALMAPDPAKRREAAELAFKTRSASSLSAVERARGKETDFSVRRALDEARAAIIVGNAEATPEDRLDAIKVIRDRGDQD